LVNKQGAKVMKNILLVLMFCIPSVQALGFNKPVIAIGSEHACILSRGVHCWGDNKFGQTDFDSKSTTDVVATAAGSHFTCNLTPHDQLLCQGESIGSAYQVQYTRSESLTHARSLVAKDSYACIIDDQGVKCFGHSPFEYDHSGLTEGEGPRDDYYWALKNAQKLFPSSDGICALADNKVQCFGFKSTALPFPLPEFKNLKELAFGAQHYCAIDDSGLHCFGDNSQGQISVPALSNPYGLTADGLTTCVLDDNGGHCWGNNVYKFKVPKNPLSLVAAQGNICAIDNIKGVTCAFKFADAKIPKDLFPTLSKPNFELNEFSDFLHVIAPGSSAARSYLFNTLADLHEKVMSQYTTTSPTVLAASNYLIASLLEPAVLGGDSEYFVKSVIPAYQASMGKVAKSGLFTKAADVPKSKFTKPIAWNVLQVSLLALGEFVQPQDKLELEKTVQLVGKLKAAPSAESELALMNSLKGLEGVFKSINETHKIYFLVKVLQNTTAWLD
jgi:alpha-tubulin suppressor-like RCC1 family protein